MPSLRQQPFFGERAHTLFRNQPSRYGGPDLREDEWRVQYVIYGFRLQVRIFFYTDLQMPAIV